MKLFNILKLKQFEEMFEKALEEVAKKFQEEEQAYQDKADSAHRWHGCPIRCYDRAPKMVRRNRAAITEREVN